MKDIEFTLLAFRPYGESSDLNESYPGVEYIDSRSDFLLYTGITHLAVTVEVVNHCETRDTCRRRGTTYDVSLINVTTGNCVSSNSFRLLLNPWQRNDRPRIDLPLTHGMIDVDHDYKVVVTERRRPSTVVIERELHFFTPAFPNRKIEVKKGYALADSCDAHLTDVDTSGCDNVTFVFEALDLRDADERMNEMEIRITPRMYFDNRVFARVRRLDDGMLRISAEFESDDLYKSPVKVDLLWFGLKISSMVVDCNLTEIEGELEGEDLHPIHDDLNQTIEDRLLQRRPDAFDSWEEMPDEQPEVDEVAEARRRLDAMTGLGDVKVKLQTYTDLMRFTMLRREAGLSGVQPPLHAMFLGAPGTGKTTVAGIIGQLLKGIGVLSKGHVVYRERSSLLGQFYHSEAEKTLEALEEAKGGVLFIDEAYQLYQPSDPKDPGRFVIDTLMTALSDESNRDWMLILAGYTEPTMKMFELNPGLRSRIPESNIYHFADYTPDELNDIARRFLSENQYELSADADAALARLLDSDYTFRGKDFGNGRHVMNVIKNGILPAMAHRLAAVENPTTEQLTLITADDIPAPRIITTCCNHRPRVGFAC